MLSFFTLFCGNSNKGILCRLTCFICVKLACRQWSASRHNRTGRRRFEVACDVTFLLRNTVCAAGPCFRSGRAANLGPTGRVLGQNKATACYEVTLVLLQIAVLAFVSCGCVRNKYLLCTDVVVYTASEYQYCYAVVLEHSFIKVSEITQCNGHCAIQGHRFWYLSKAHILLPITD